MLFEELVEKLSPKLKRITYKLNGHFTFFDEDDLYQESLLHLWLDFKNEKLSDKTDSYILQGCYFHLKNYIRGVRDRVNLVSIERSFDNGEGGEVSEEIMSLETSRLPLGEIDNKIIFEQVINNSLTQREKEVLRFSLEGLTTREVGRKFGVSHVRIVKIKDEIKKKCLKKRDEF